MSPTQAFLHLTIDGEQGVSDWQPFLDVVTVKVLREHSSVLSCLSRLDPGAILRPHRHRKDEECAELKGRLRVPSKMEMRPGNYPLVRSAALHGTIGTESGATVLLRGAVPNANHLPG